MSLRAVFGEKCDITLCISKEAFSSFMCRIASIVAEIRESGQTDAATIKLIERRISFITGEVGQIKVTMSATCERDQFEHQVFTDILMLHSMGHHNANVNYSPIRA
jgi:chorismate mutase